MCSAFEALGIEQPQQACRTVHLTPAIVCKAHVMALFTHDVMKTSPGHVSENTLSNDTPKEQATA